MCLAYLHGQDRSEGSLICVGHASGKQSTNATVGAESAWASGDPEGKAPFQDCRPDPACSAESGNHVPDQGNKASMLAEDAYLADHGIIPGRP